MPLNPNFNVTQSLVIPNNDLTFADLSTGSDGTIVTRRITTTDSYGNKLVVTGTTTDYELWPYPIGTPITLALLSGATAPSIKVEWMDAGNVAVYTLTKTFNFNNQSALFELSLTLRQVANNSITQDVNWYNNKMQLIVNDNDAQNAINYASNITLAQNSLARNTFMIQNQGDFF